MKIHIPTALSIALAIVAGVLEGLNLTTFGFAPGWQYLVTVGIDALACIGISPLTGPALQSVLHLTHATVLSLTALISTATIAVTQVSMNTTIKGIIIGVLALIGGVLLGTDPTPTTTSPNASIFKFKRQPATV